jgi:hypothetical protein
MEPEEIHVESNTTAHSQEVKKEEHQEILLDEQSEQHEKPNEKHG